MLNLIPFFCQTHNYRKPHPNTDGGNVEKRRPDTWTLSPKRILTSLTYIAECATNHSLRFSTGTEFSKTMEIRAPDSAGGAYNARPDPLAGLYIAQIFRQTQPAIQYWF